MIELPNCETGVCTLLQWVPYLVALTFSLQRRSAVHWNRARQTQASHSETFAADNLAAAGVPVEFLRDSGTTTSCGRWRQVHTPELRILS